MIEDRLIDIRKQNTYEAKLKSKVLAVYAIESEAKEVNKMLCLMKLSRFKYVLYHHSTLQDKLAAMHYSEIKNSKI